MVQMVEQTYDEQVKMYMKCTKHQLIDMLIECNKHLQKNSIQYKIKNNATSKED